MHSIVSNNSSLHRFDTDESIGRLQTVAVLQCIGEQKDKRIYVAISVKKDGDEHCNDDDDDDNDNNDDNDDNNDNNHHNSNDNTNDATPFISITCFNFALHRRRRGTLTMTVNQNYAVKWSSRRLGSFLFTAARVDVASTTPASMCTIDNFGFRRQRLIS